MQTLRLSDRAGSLKPSPTLGMTARAKALADQGHDVVAFAAGEPDFNTPDAVCEAAIKALHDGMTRYAPARGVPKLREAIVRKVKRENGFDCTADEIVVSCGAKHSLYNTFQVLLDPGDEVVLFAPYWMTYRDQVELAGGVPVIVPSTIDEGFVPPMDRVKAAITPKTKAVVLNTPSNPTGGAWSRQQIKELAALALKHGFWVISDEIYERLTYDHEHQSIAALGKDIAAQTVTVLGCSKTFAMTGWRIGFTVAPKEVTTAMANLQDQVTSNATTFAQYGAATALDLPDSVVEDMRSTFERRRNLGLGLLRNIPGVNVSDPRGAFYFFADFSSYLGDRWADDVALAEHLLDESYVACVPGSVFEGAGHLRLSYAASEADIEKGIRRIHDVLTT